MPVMLSGNPVATTEHPELVSSGAGLASTVAAETHGEISADSGVRARGYWEGVFLRFRRDKFAIAAGVYIVLLVLVGLSVRRSPRTSSATGRTTCSRAASTRRACCRSGR